MIEAKKKNKKEPKKAVKKTITLFPELRDEIVFTDQKYSSIDDVYQKEEE